MSKRSGLRDELATLIANMETLGHDDTSIVQMVKLRLDQAGDGATKKAAVAKKPGAPKRKRRTKAETGPAEQKANSGRELDLPIPGEPQ